MRSNVVASALIGLSLSVAGWGGIAAAEPADTGLSTPTERAPTIDCSDWTLDGYRLGMLGDELLALRSVTLHTQGQAQAIEPGKFHGVLVLDGLNSLKKWDVIYQTTEGSALRAELGARFGKPNSDVSGSMSDDDPAAGRQRRTIWWSRACDIAIILYESTPGDGTTGHTVSATLARASSLTPGLVEMKTLFH